MNSAKWTWFAIGYQTLLAYATSLVIYNLGSLFSGAVNALTVVGSVASVAIIAFAIYLLARPYKEATKLEIK
jgi:ferrous iron transport protein B